MENIRVEKYVDSIVIGPTMWTFILIILYIFNQNVMSLGSMSGNLCLVSK